MLATRALAFLGIALVAAGCATSPYQMFDGEERPSDEIAVIRAAGTHHQPNSKVTPQIASIDGVGPPGLVLVGAAAVLPGKCEVRIRLLFDDDNTETGPQVFTSRALAFDAKPGHTYVADGLVDEELGLRAIQTSTSPMTEAQLQKMIDRGALKFWIDDTTDKKTVATSAPFQENPL